MNGLATLVSALCLVGGHATFDCDLYVETCSQVDGYKAYPDCAGTVTMSGADGMTCRITHLGLAKDDPALHCPHAAADATGPCASEKLAPKPTSTAQSTATGTMAKSTATGTMAKSTATGTMAKSTATGTMAKSTATGTMAKSTATGTMAKGGSTTAAKATGTMAKATGTTTAAAVMSKVNIKLTVVGLTGKKSDDKAIVTTAVAKTFKVPETAIKKLTLTPIARRLEATGRKLAAGDYKVDVTLEVLPATLKKVEATATLLKASPKTLTTALKTALEAKSLDATKAMASGVTADVMTTTTKAPAAAGGGATSTSGSPRSSSIMSAVALAAVGVLVSS